MAWKLPIPGYLTRLGRMALAPLDMPLGIVIGQILRFVRFFAIPVLAFFPWIEYRQPPLWPLSALARVAVADPLMYVLLLSVAFSLIDVGSMILHRSRRLQQGDSRSNHFLLAIEEIHKQLKIRSKTSDFSKAWERLMIAAEIELSQELGLAGSQAIKANLILAEPDDWITVVARSQPGSDCPKRYSARKDWPAYRAMVENDTIVKSNIPDEELPSGGRPYHCVGATPIYRHERAFGAITVDSSDGKLLKGKEDVIDRVLRPYGAIILLTVQPDAPCHKCPDRHAR